MGMPLLLALLVTARALINHSDNCIYKGEILPVGQKIALAEKCAWIVCYRATINNREMASLDVEESHPGHGCCTGPDGSIIQDGGNTTLPSGLEVSCCRGKWMQLVHVDPLYASTEKPTFIQPAIDGDVVLLTGGSGGPSPEATIISADVFGQSNCSASFILPDQRIGHTSHYVDGQVLICGSSGMAEPPAASRSCLQLQDGEFSIHSQLNHPRFMHVGLILDGKLNLIGSISGPGGSREADGSVETLTGTTWSECGSQLCQLGPSVGDSCAVALDDKRALIIGGGEDGNQVFMHEIGAGWKSVRRLPGKRFAHSCAILPNGDVLVAGGYDGGRNSSTVTRKVLDTAIIYQLDQSLELPGRMTTGRVGGEMVNLRGRILYFGGKSSFADQEGLDTVEEFHQDTRTWTLLKETMDRPRQYFSAVVVPGSAVGC